MYTLWVIAKARADGSPLAAALVGNHAVRLFASLQSFTTLARIAGRQPPDAIVVDLDDAAVTPAAVSAAAHAVVPGIPVVCIVSDGEGTLALLRHMSTVGRGASGIDAGAECSIVQRSDDPMVMERTIAAALTALAPPARRILRFKDLALDLDALCVRCGASGVESEIPLKEAQLLKLFLERPGVCLSRDEIKDVIWQRIKVTPRTIDTHVSKLRKRLLGATVTIESVYGDGYVLR